MNTILEMREKRAKVWETAKAFLDSKRGTDGIVSPEDTAVYEKMEADVVALGKEIDRMEKQAAIDAELSKATGTPITNAPVGDAPDDTTGRASSEYKHSFWNAMRGQFNLEIKNSLKIGEDTEGGYLVPDEFERQLIEALEEENIFRRFATIIQTSSGDRKIPVVASKGEASWVDEEGAIPESDDKFGQQTLSAYKVATMIKISEELLNDSAFNMPAYIAKEFGRRIGNREEESFIIGDGTGKPLGLLADTGGAEVGVTATSETAITLDDVLDLFYSLKSPYRRTASFIMNDSTVKAIRKLKDSTGQYLWQPSIKEATPDTILSRPLYTSAYMPELGAGVKPISFGDYRYYWIADRQGRVFKRLNELYASTGQVGFLAWQRVDGKLILPEAVKVLKMSGTAPAPSPSPAPARAARKA
ncbi:phage major capsid protein [Eubacteriales bacterium OttesenSCG-928-A19]|nr:phage major capsid protein [Eubacteriales bacterium OttesenSCG-928-A19]